MAKIQLSLQVWLAARDYTKKEHTCTSRTLHAQNHFGMGLTSLEGQKLECFK